MSVGGVMTSSHRKRAARPVIDTLHVAGRHFDSVPHHAAVVGRPSRPRVLLEAMRSNLHAARRVVFFERPPRQAGGGASQSFEKHVNGTNASPPPPALLRVHGEGRRLRVTEDVFPPQSRPP